MAIKKYKPYTPSRRYMTTSDFSDITASKPEKSLLEPLKKSGGRNHHGHVTSWHRGGGHKRAYRRIDFRRNKHGIPAKVATIEYDPNRSARIALLHYVDGEKRYIIAPLGLKVGDRIVSGPDAEPRTGNALPLSKITGLESLSLMLWAVTLTSANPSMRISSIKLLRLFASSISFWSALPLSCDVN